MAPGFWSQLTIPAAAAINAAASKDRALAAAGSRSAVPLTYGEDRLGALILNVLPAGANSTTLLVQCLWGFAGESIADMRLNDLALPAGSTATHYTGSQSTVDSAMAAAFAAKSLSYTDTLAGYAYSVLAMPVRAFDGQLNISARVRGRTLYDPRLDSTAGGSGGHSLATPSTWAWSDNPALALADYVASGLYGLSRTVNWATVGAAATHCDAMIGTPAEKRRTLGVSFIAPVQAASIAEALRAYAGCFLVGGGASVGLLADQDATAAASYSHAAGEIAVLSGLTKRDLGNQPTAVEVLYTDISQVPWREASVTAQASGAGTTRPWRLSQVRLPGVQRGTQAYREAVERLNKLTLSDLSCSLEVFDIGLRHEVGDIITVTHPLGLSAKAMRVGAVDMPGPGRWRLALAEHDAGAYSTAVVAQPSTQDGGYANPAGPPAAVAGFTATNEEVGVRLRWAANAETDVAGYELRQGGANWAAGLPLDGSAATLVGGTTHLWVQLTPGSYTLRIKARDSGGLVSGSDATAAVTVGASPIRNDNIRVGGVNLVGNSGFQRHSAGIPTNWGPYNNAGGSHTPEVRVGEGMFAQNAFRLTANVAVVANTFGVAVVQNVAESAKWTAGQYHVISFWARGYNGAVGKGMSSAFRNNPPFLTQDGIESPVLSNDWQRWSMRVMVQAGASTAAGELFLSWDQTGTLAAGSIIDICCPKVELGSQVSGWSPAALDTLNTNVVVSEAGAISGIGTGDGRSVANNQNNIIRAPGGGHFNTTTSAIPGAIKIQLPVFFTDTMLRFSVDIYEYDAGYSCTLDIAGYANFGSSSWSHVTARVSGGSNVEYPVRFGHSGGKACIWIGDPTGASDWSYPQVRVRDVFLGYANGSRAAWEAGWVITFDTSATSGWNVSQTVADTYPAADWAKVAGGGKPANNATVGAPAGTLVGGTAAATVESNAAAGAAANTTLTTPRVASPLPFASWYSATGGTTCVVGVRVKTTGAIATKDTGSGSTYTDRYAWYANGAPGTHYVRFTQDSAPVNGTLGGGAVNAGWFATTSDRTVTLTITGGVTGGYALVRYEISTTSNGDNIVGAGMIELTGDAA